jgi:hypothetical protein
MHSGSSWRFLHYQRKGPGRRVATSPKAAEFLIFWPSVAFAEKAVGVKKTLNSAFREGFRSVRRWVSMRFLADSSRAVTRQTERAIRLGGPRVRLDRAPRWRRLRSPARRSSLASCNDTAQPRRFSALVCRARSCCCVLTRAYPISRFAGFVLRLIYDETKCLIFRKQEASS